MTRTKKSAAGILVGMTILVLSGCQGALDGVSKKANVPVPQNLVFKMKAKGMRLTSPILLRIYKQENTLEVWKQKANGRYALLTDFEICKWSGKFGPKFKEGDRQAPEGFYKVNKHQMNPNSQYHLSFNLGYPNAFDRAHGRSGAHLMVHGACSSAGCYSMTDEYVEVIYALARDAFKGGQKSFQVQAFPFKLTAENMVKHRQNRHIEFWNMLRKGSEMFEITKLPPKVNVCERRYEFGTQSKLRYPSSGKCPPRMMNFRLASAYLKRENSYLKKYETLLAKAEGRAVKQVSPLTFATALPGVRIEGLDASKIVSSKAATEPIADGPVVIKRGATPPPVMTSPSQSSDLEAILKPAG